MIQNVLIGKSRCFLFETRNWNNQFDLTFFWINILFASYSSGLLNRSHPANSINLANPGY